MKMVLVSLVGLLFLSAFPACVKKSPAEKAEEHMENAVEEAGDAMKEAGEAAGEEMDEATGESH
ncbi:MAG: hypothetical protein H6617_07210 [Bdellovibrionaceae bacterium]|nr:hypothetical protein [Bdellovibrionales bacterium]MCB9254456.1 hypothetical protein [Pseudobdellovibrionaceae bacterium]